MLLLLLLSLAWLFLSEERRCHRGFSLVTRSCQTRDRCGSVSPGSLLRPAGSSFSTHRCPFLFGAGGMVAGAGSDVILDSPAFTQETPTPPAKLRTGRTAAALNKEGRPLLWVLDDFYSERSKKHQKAGHPSHSHRWAGTRFQMDLFFGWDSRSSRWKKKPNTLVPTPPK